MESPFSIKGKNRNSANWIYDHKSTMKHDKDTRHIHTVVFMLPTKGGATLVQGVSQLFGKKKFIWIFFIE